MRQHLLSHQPESWIYTHHHPRLTNARPIISLPKRRTGGSNPSIRVFMFQPTFASPQIITTDHHQRLSTDMVVKPRKFVTLEIGSGVILKSSPGARLSWEGISLPFRLDGPHPASTVLILFASSIRVARAFLAFGEYGGLKGR